MAITWWQKLRQPKARPAGLKVAEDEFGFRTSHSPSTGWRLQLESKPVQVGLVAAARVLPALITGYTYDFPDQETRRIPRGAERLALLRKIGTGL